MQFSLNVGMQENTSSVDLANALQAVAAFVQEQWDGLDRDTVDDMAIGEQIVLDIDEVVRAKNLKYAFVTRVR